MIADLAPIARLIGMPYFRSRRPGRGWDPLGLIPLPSKWRIQFHPPIHVEEYPPEAADDQNLVMSLSDEVRGIIQAGIYDNLNAPDLFLPLITVYIFLAVASGGVGSPAGALVGAYLLMTLLESRASLSS